MASTSRHPIGGRVATTHVELDQPVDHESRRDVDAILAGIPAVPLYLAVEIGDREGLGKFHPAIALDPPDDVVGRGIEVRPAAMAVEFEFLAMRATAAITVSRP